MTALEQLQAARSLIANGWTQNQSACTADMRPTSPWNKNAESFCAVGALMAVTGIGTNILIKGLPAPTADISITKTLTDFNDHPNTTQADVLALYDHLIEEIERLHD
jgi:hypothetical protein